MSCFLSFWCFGFVLLFLWLLGWFFGSERMKGQWQTFACDTSLPVPLPTSYLRSLEETSGLECCFLERDAFPGVGLLGSGVRGYFEGADVKVISRCVLRPNTGWGCGEVSGADFLTAQR
jgi:hypothetical protein